MTIEELIAAAKAAILAGDLEKAEQLTNQAKALKAVQGLEDPPPPQTLKSAEMQELETLRTFKEKIDAEPPQKAADTLVVVEDETDKKAAKPWKSLGEQLQAVYTAAMTPYRTDERLKAQKAVLGLSEGTPADGGFLVQQDFAAGIFQLAHTGGEILSRVRNIPISASANGLKMNAIDETSRVTGSRWGGIQSYWESEGGTATATKPKLRQIEMGLNKLFAVMYATDELLQDTTALGAISQQAVAEEMIWQTENAIFRGTGAGQPQGVLNATATISQPKESGQAAATIMVNNITKMWSRMWGRSRLNAIWFYNQDIEPQMMALEFPVGTGGVPIFLPPGGLSDTPYGKLLGRPMIPVEYASTLGTVGDLVLFDPSQYLTIDKGGVNAQESMHVQFLTDQMTYRWTYRIDGQLAWRTALTPANGSNTLSPVVSLATRS